MNPKPEAATVPAGDFVGRRKELELFGRMLEKVLDRKLEGLLVNGPPGIGKTRLAQEMALRAERAGFLVVWGRWREGVVLPEYWVWRQVLRGLLRAHPQLAKPGSGMDSALSELSALLPELRDERPGLAPPLSGDGSRARLFDAVYRLLRRACAARPLMIVLDNVHLAGAASLELLEGLFDELAEWALLPAATCRDLPAYQKDPFLAFLAEARKLPTVLEYRLENLSPRETTTLVEGILEMKPPEPLVREILRRTEGNPLFVREAAQLVRGRLNHPEVSPERVWNEELPQAVGVAITRRLLQVSPACLEVLQRAALFGENVSAEELGLAFAGAVPGNLEEALQEGVEHGFLHRDDGRGEYRFSHAVVQTAIRQHLPPAERGRLCAQLSAEIERARADDLKPWALKLAGWWAEVEGAEARERERRYTRLAAETALEAAAWEEAIGLYGRLAGPVNEEAGGEEEEAEACFGLGRALFMSGDRAGAVPVFRKAFTWFRRAGNLERMVQIATQPGYLNAGQPGFYNFFEGVLEAVPPGLPLEGLVLHFYGIARFNALGDYPGAERLLQRSYEIGVHCGDLVLQARNLSAMAFVDNIFGRFEQAAARAEQARQLLRITPDPFTEGHTCHLLVTTFMAMGRIAESIQQLQRGMLCARRMRDGFFIATGYSTFAKLELLAGTWETVRRHTEEGLAAYPDHLILTALRVFLEYATGNFAAGDAFRERILALQRRTPAGPWHVHVHAAATAAVRARNSGDTSGLEMHLPMLRSIAAHPEAHPFVRIRAHLLRAFIAAQIGDAALARQAYEAVVAEPPLYLIRPYLTERFLGLAAHCFGDHPKAAAHLEEALRLARHYCDRPLEAWILCELGEVLAPHETGQPVQPRGAAPQDPPACCAKLLEALRLARRLGMPPLERRVREALERLAAGPDGAPPLHLHLSEREEKILALAAEGLPYTGIARLLGISPDAVAGHVGRAELAADCRLLSRREAEIVRLLSLRLTAADIGEMLGISRRTVERHLANVYAKLRVRHRRELLARIYGSGGPGRPGPSPD